MRSFFVTILVIALSSNSGCKRTTAPKAYRAYGHVIVGTIPAAKACIAFHPIDQKKSQGRCPVALTRADGSFDLTTYTMYDGAPVGDYTVTVLWLDEKTLPIDDCECINPLLHDRLGGRCADPDTTPLMATVFPKENELIFWTPGVSKNPFAGTQSKQPAAQPASITP